MFHIIGLKQSGEMSLYDSPSQVPNLFDLETACRSFRYVQLLIVSDEAGQVKRFTFDLEPRLREVPIRGIL